MRLSHEAVKEKLPEYINEGTMPDDIKEHLNTCTECSQEASILKVLLADQVPEPGNMFFETLPRKIRASLGEKKKGFFLRLAPVFALIALVVIAGYMYKTMTTSTPVIDEDIYFSSPFTDQTYDLSYLDPEDIPSISETIDENELYITDESSFIKEFASLSSEEMEDLYEALKIVNSNGGVL